MAVLLGEKAKGLGDIMSKNGLGGLGSSKSSSPSADEELEDESEDLGQSELDLCISDLTDAILEGDKDSIKSAVRDLVDCIKQEDDEEY